MPDQDVHAGTPDPDELQVVVLNEVLIRFPAQLTLREVTLGLNHDPDDFAQSDAVRLAVDELVAAGLLRLNAEAIVPTRAALRANELWGIVVG
jgi:hypothetical protein